MKIFIGRKNKCQDGDLLWQEFSRVFQGVSKVPFLPLRVWRLPDEKSRIQGKLGFQAVFHRCLKKSASVFWPPVL
jgi:hypothetical protein